MGNLIAELKRRHIYRVAAAYAVVAWVLLQIVNNIIPLIQAPVWTGQFCLLLLALGFPIAVFFAWMRELPSSDTAAPVRTSVMDGALIGVLVIVIALISYQQFGAAPSRSSSLEAAREASVKSAGVSIAVLPFVNLSSDKEQEFFSDGITEEITSALARVPDLRVVARTSAFEFKGKNVNIKAMGEALGATHLIEGSVRKAGDKLRITAQLIKADDGTHVWAEDYDRQLTDVFQIQEEIARAIATSLRMPLGLKPGENLVRNRNVDPDSHEKFLRAKALYDGREGAVLNYAQAESLLTDAIAKNPDYALAFALLAAVHYEHANSFVDANEPVATIRARIDDLRTNGEAAAKRAIDADPNLAWGYAMSAVFTWSRSKPQEAEELFLKALALDPTDPYALDEYTNRLGTAGRLKDALATAEKAHAVEPFQPGISRRTVANLWLSGNNDAAIAIAKTLRAADRVLWLTRIYASMGRYDEAADALMETASDPNSAAAQAVRLLRTAPTKVTSSESLPRLPRTLEYVYLYAGAPERALGPYARMGQVDYFWGNNGSFFWHPVYAPVRKSEEFKNLVRKAGLVEYWRAKGWPDACHPTTGDDFECN